MSFGDGTLRPFGPPTQVVVGTLNCCPLDGVDHKTDISLHYKLAELLHCIKLTAQIRRDEGGRFWLGGSQKRGITAAVKALLPYDETNVDRETYQPYRPFPERVERYQNQGTPGHHKSGCYAALLATVRLLKSAPGSETLLDALTKGLRDMRGFPLAHGQLVDYQFECFVNLSWREFCNVCPVIDPCVATGLEVIKRKGWVLVAAQVAVYNERTDLASAIDLIATDDQADPVASERRIRKAASPDAANLYLIEVKSRCSCNPHDDYYNGYGQIKTGVFAKERMSQYTRDQTQLLLLQKTVTTMCDVAESLKDVHRRHPRPTRTVRFKDSVVLRLEPGLGHCMSLSDSILARYNTITEALKHLRISLTVPPSLDLGRECTGCERPLTDRPRFQCTDCSGFFCKLCEAYCRCMGCNSYLCEACETYSCSECRTDL